MRRGSAWGLLSLLLSMSLGGCGGCDKGPAYERPEPARNRKDEFVFVPSKEEVMWMTEVDLETVEGVNAEVPAGFGEGEPQVRWWTDEKGVRHVEVKGPPDHPFLYVSETQPDGSKRMLLDADGDGKPDKRAEKRPADKTYVLELDTNGDGVFDERIVSTIDVASKAKHSVFEKKVLGLFWKKTREETGHVASLMIHYDFNE